MLSHVETMALAEAEGVGCPTCLPGTKQRWFRCPRCHRTAREVRLVLQAQALLEALSGRLCCRPGSATECGDCFRDRALITSIESKSVDDVVEAQARERPEISRVSLHGQHTQEIQYTGYAHVKIPGQKGG